ncbi:helix-turn-helix transcriptional regulator [bacterium]|nr:helix-turn-helix transcriptional regulator [bacterium]
MQETLKFLGKRIADLRNKRGMTQEKLAELVHYSSNHISKIESGRSAPSFDLLFMISKSLEVELKDLFNFDEYKESEYIHKELNKILNSGESKKLSILYKLYRIMKS